MTDYRDDCQQEDDMHAWKHQQDLERQQFERQQDLERQQFERQRSQEKKERDQYRYLQVCRIKKPAVKKAIGMDIYEAWIDRVSAVLANWSRPKNKKSCLKELDDFEKEHNLTKF